MNPLLRYTVLALFSGLTGCVVTPYEPYPTYPSTGGMGSVEYRGGIVEEAPYYVYRNTTYYYIDGRYVYYSSGRRYYVADLPRGGHYTHRNSKHYHTPAAMPQSRTPSRYQSYPAANQAEQRNVYRQPQSSSWSGRSIPNAPATPTQKGYYPSPSQAPTAAPSSNRRSLPQPPPNGRPLTPSASPAPAGESTPARKQRGNSNKPQPDGSGS